ncbi:MAG: hypothetical protein O4751_08980 [Trichodesmium sp. St2_bin6]|nr:hypothetical protein [Trichodesmium sp. St2_bin6]MDE5095170.1 hypothetical protein [Trichodesmium sp. St11_bin5]MDT9342386.1 hypothetical protein [Trichodesmium erythraeum 21-75]
MGVSSSVTDQAKIRTQKKVKPKIIINLAIASHHPLLNSHS